MSCAILRTLRTRFATFQGVVDIPLSQLTFTYAIGAFTCASKRGYITKRCDRHYPTYKHKLIDLLSFPSFINSSVQVRSLSHTIENIHDRADISKGLALDPAFGKEFEMVVLTLRADRIAGLSLGYTRRKMEYAILSGFVFLNGEMLTSKSGQIKEGDTLDVIRKSMSTDEMFVFDRIIFLRCSGTTKNGKQRIQLRRYKALSCLPSEFWRKSSE